MAETIRSLDKIMTKSAKTNKTSLRNLDGKFAEGKTKNGKTKRKTT